jgi:hypothetical protein
VPLDVTGTPSARPVDGTVTLPDGPAVGLTGAGAGVGAGAGTLLRTTAFDSWLPSPTLFDALAVQVYEPFDAGANVLDVAPAIGLPFSDQLYDVADEGAE